ncbi:MlaD family protein [[Mycobacterium] nativiensis]|uniref:MlaD family protein n=1 Tax=[Mycobacterium] nativiensis TaxID=2855503 RepID=A0ABU5XV62_9MYCO|nr:MlaD family protein [Mycolicibacter sp. MYC340]MEB3031825.1 MlaD family protein [Mycolicibacter sp. MYC340]
MRPTRNLTRRAVLSTAALSLVAIVSGCGVGLESLPLAGPGSMGGTYRLNATFANALNLPAKAKVKLNGANIGEVESIRAEDFTATVAMRIRDDVRLQDGLTVELRSATPLGDLFVAVHPGPDPTSPLLHDGDTISLRHTDGGATIENVLSAAATLVSGGVIRNITTLVNGGGKAVGGNGTNIKELLDNSTTLIARLNARSAQIEASLDSTSQLAAALSDRRNTLDSSLSALAPAVTVLADNTGQIADLIVSTSRITRQLYRFPSLQGTDTRSLIADLNDLSATFNDITVDPNLSLARLNRLLPILLKATNSTAVKADADLGQLALGSMPDMNYPGSTMFHGPDGTDYHAMIGSLRYEWNLLLNKIYGPNR